VKIYEDGVEQQIANFADATPNPGKATTPQTVDNSVFILMDTSNSMYEEFMRASDTVADFVRGVSAQNAVAIYTFSRNMYRATHLSHDALQRVSALRTRILGDDTAIFNSLLLTVRDAARVPGNKTIVLLSNGPDTASIVSPDDVARVAREEGIPIHVVYTREKDELLNAVFSRVATSTGGQAHVARTWDQQKAAFNLIRDELTNAYTIAHYPRPSENEGFRKITLEIVSDTGKRYRVRARPGYKPATGRRLPPCVNCRLAQAVSLPASSTHQ
jgi:VWFA-related protein